MNNENLNFDNVGYINKKDIDSKIPVGKDFDEYRKNNTQYQKFIMTQAQTYTEWSNEQRDDFIKGLIQQGISAEDIKDIMLDIQSAANIDITKPLDAPKHR